MIKLVNTPSRDESKVSDESQYSQNKSPVRAPRWCCCSLIVLLGPRKYAPKPRIKYHKHDCYSDFLSQQTCPFRNKTTDQPVFFLLLLATLQQSAVEMPPANAAAICQVLTDIANFSSPLSTRSDQQTYLKKLTSTHKFTYYSATYGHTTHDAASLRKVLANTMRYHPNPGFGAAGGNAAVDMLFQHGCEMLEATYLEEVRLAAEKEVVERRALYDDVDDGETSVEEEGEDMLGLDVRVGESSEHDEDFVPSRRRLRGREFLNIRKRTASVSSSEGGTISTAAEGSWQDSRSGKIKRKQARQVVEAAATTSPFGESRRETIRTKRPKAWRRPDVGEWSATR